MERPGIQADPDEIREFCKDRLAAYKYPRIVEIIDLDSLEWQVPLSTSDVAQMRVGMTASLNIEGLIEPLTARVARINPSAATDTRQVMVYLSLPRHPALRQGMFGQGQITVDSREGLAVPSSAISRESGRDEVLRIDGDRIVRVAVDVGRRAARADDAAQPFVEITAGLKAGDRLLHDARGTVREGARVVQPAPSTVSR